MLAVRAGGRDAGAATPHHITRHAHPKARPENPAGGDIPRATGIDYLALIDTQHTRQVAGPVNYAALNPPPPGSQHGDPPASQEGR